MSRVEKYKIGTDYLEKYRMSENKVNVNCNYMVSVPNQTSSQRSSDKEKPNDPPKH